MVVAVSTVFGYDRKYLIGRETIFLSVEDASRIKFITYL